MPDQSFTPEEVANILKISKYTVYELIKRGDLAAYRIGRKVRVEEADLAKYKQRFKGENNVTGQETEVTTVISPGLSNAALVLCGQDIILDTLTRHLVKRMPQLRLMRQYIGSIDGLMALYKGMANAVTAHLWAGDTDEYNLPYVRRLLPGHKTVLINLVYRMEGFYVAKDNPKGIKNWQDLARPDLVFVNRECGSGARVLLDEQLRKQEIERLSVNGYEHEEMSHIAVASKVARGEADLGLGIEQAARQVQNVEFIPLHKERYDLVIRAEELDQPQFQALLSILNSRDFQNEVLGIGSYDVSSMGKIMGIV